MVLLNTVALVGPGARELAPEGTTRNKPPAQRRSAKSPAGKESPGRSRISRRRRRPRGLARARAAPLERIRGTGRRGRGGGALSQRKNRDVGRSPGGKTLVHKESTRACELPFPAVQPLDLVLLQTFTHVGEIR